MNEKMSVEEFMEVFEKFYNFKVWGWEGILNIIALWEYHQYKNFKSQRLNSIADDSMRRAEGITKILKERGLL